MLDGKTIQSAHVILGERESGGFGPGELFLNFTDGSQVRLWVQDGCIASQMVNEPADAGVA